MSLEGVQDGVKDGGAQRGPHDGHSEHGLLTSDSLFGNGISFTSGNARIESGARCLQNGGQSEHSGCAVSELLSDCDETFTIPENNVVWLKSRCKNIGDNVSDFDCVVKENDDHCDSELFQGDMSEIEEGGGVDLVGHSPDKDRVNSDVKPSDSQSTVPGEDFSNEGVTVHFGEFSSADMKNRQQDEFELNIPNFRVKNDSVALMTPQELESLPNQGLEFEDSLVTMAYPSPNYPHHNASTKQESPTLSPPNQTTLKCHLIDVSNDSSDELSLSAVPSSENKDCNEKETPNTMTDLSSKQNIPDNCSSGHCSSSSSFTATSPQSSGPVTDSQVDPTNLTLATISISTDKAANSTQILVNTTQGQQLYLINTADLTQATNALQPLAQPSVSKTTAPNVFSPLASTTPLTGSQSLVQSVDHQHAVQPLPLQIQNTGYILLPVTQPESSSGLLVTTPLAAMPSDIVCQSRRVWICPEKGCDKVFRKLSKLKIHQMRHTGERPFKCSRHGCDWAFTTAYKLKRHEESHEGRKDYNCDFPGCGRKFTTVYNLNSHKKLHERPCTETCPEPGCAQSFPTKRQLDLHVRTHTGLEKTYKCPVSGCDKVFFSPNCMGSHTRVHLTDRQDLTCKFEGCGKVFDKQCRLKQHERRHTGEKPYVCQFQGCNWAFTTASKLKRHKAKHTGLRKWICNVCKKGFMRAEHLKGHLVTHSGVKPFICPVEGCKARFTAKSSLYVHLKKHDASGKKITYHCPMEGCVRNYSSKAGLRNHILKHYLSTPSGTDPSSALDWVPLLGGDDDNSLESLVHSTTDSVAGIASSSSGGNALLQTPIQLLDASSQEKNVTTNEFNADGDCLSAEQLSSSIVSQLIANNPLQATGPAADASGSSKPHHTVTAAVQPALQPTTIKSQPKIAIATDSTGPAPSTVALANSSGSARTDYKSNHMLSERARRRWHRIKNGGSLQGLENDVLDTTSAEKADSACPLFSSDLLSSTQGVMFRDPETGITYVQTQLLQDDPPHPPLYDDKESSDTSVSATVSFSGTTINLQDLK